MQQMLLVIFVGYMCIRCLALSVQGQVRGCESGEPRCIDVDLHMQLERRRPPQEPRSWDEETWQLGQRSRPPATAPHLVRKRPRSFQLAASDKTSW